MRLPETTRGGDHAAFLNSSNNVGLCGRFCCKSRLRQAAKRDSVALTQILGEVDP